MADGESAWTLETSIELHRRTEYPMPVTETLIHATAGHKILSFMDDNAGYNQIFMAPEDIYKTTFSVPGAVGYIQDHVQIGQNSFHHILCPFAALTRQMMES
jgi:hypothetical protein